MTAIDDTIDMGEWSDLIAHSAETAASAFSVLLTYVGDRLGLYEAMADGGPMTAAELAEVTGTHERMITLWLGAMAASQFVTYDAVTGRFELPPTSAAFVIDGRGFVSGAGGAQMIVSAFRNVDRLVDAMRTGRGLGWADQHPDLFAGMDRQTAVAEKITSELWLQFVRQLVPKDGTIANIACARGATSLLMAGAHPSAAIRGFDFHAGCVDDARRAAAEAGLDDRVSFEVADAGAFPGRDYDLVTFIGSFHDLGDPVGAARHARSALAPGAAVLLREANVSDRLEDNLTPTGVIRYGISAAICTPCALDQGGPGIGLPTRAVLSALFHEAGFATIERVAEDSSHAVYLARPSADERDAERGGVDESQRRGTSL